MTTLADKAKEYYTKGYSCSESIIQAANDFGILPQGTDVNQLNKIASAFSGGMGAGCLCGAVAGSQIITGLIYGRENKDSSPAEVKNKAKQVIDDFKKLRKTTCCRALTAPSHITPENRRAYCADIVRDAAGVLENIVFAGVK